MLPLGAFLPVAAVDAWVSWDNFWKGDAMYAACTVSFTTAHAIFYRLMYATFLLEHHEEAPQGGKQPTAVGVAVGKGTSGARRGDGVSDPKVDPKAAKKPRRERARSIYQLSFFMLFAANAVMTQMFLSILNVRHDIALDIGKRNMLVVVSVFSVFVVPAAVFILRGDFVSLDARLTGAIWLGMILPQFAGFTLGTVDTGEQEALRAFLLRLAPALTLLCTTYATLLALLTREIRVTHGSNFWLGAFVLFFIFPALGVFVSRHVDNYGPDGRRAADFGLTCAALAPFLVLVVLAARRSPLWKHLNPAALSPEISQTPLLHYL